MYVIDASVAVKWLIPEERRAEARSFLTGSDALLAPRLIVTEVATGLSRKARVGQISKPAARRALREWLSLIDSGGIELADSEALIEEALEISLALNHPLPDCLYLALAKQSQAVFVTADQPLAKKAAELHGLKVRLLSAG
jgi:predicted nucleic acid-binding protein